MVIKKFIGCLSIAMKLVLLFTLAIGVYLVYLDYGMGVFTGFSMLISLSIFFYLSGVIDEWAKE